MWVNKFAHTLSFICGCSQDWILATHVQDFGFVNVNWHVSIDIWSNTHRARWSCLLLAEPLVPRRSPGPRHQRKSGCARLFGPKVPLCSPSRRVFVGWVSVQVWKKGETGCHLGELPAELETLQTWKRYDPCLWQPWRRMLRCKWPWIGRAFYWTRLPRPALCQEICDWPYQKPLTE